MPYVFKTPRGFAVHLRRSAFLEYEALRVGLKECAKKIKKTAKDEIGHYQPEVSSFPAWKELAPSTKKDRVRKGFSENDPLLRTGEMRDSIGYRVERLEAAIGSTSDIMVYQELGTKNIPARPVLGPAAFRNKKFIQETLGLAAVSGIMGGKSLTTLGHNKGYDFISDEE